MGGASPQRAGPDSRGSARDQGILSLPRRLSARLRRDLAAGAGFVLILDYDGTLAPIVPSPQRARLAPSLRQTLARLAGSRRVRVAILSGRSLRDIKARVGLRRVVYGGCHGLEIQGEGFRFRHPGARARSSCVRSVTRALARQRHLFPGVLLEHKGLCVSLHYRRVPRRLRDDLLSLAARVERQARAVRVLPGKHVLDFIPRVRWGKGQAVRWIARRLAAALRQRRVVTVYAGDDATDEAAFSALKRRGLTIRVGAGKRGADHAVRHVRTMHALLRWLARATA